MFAVEDYRRDWERSVSPNEKEEFFREKAESLSWFTPWRKVLDASDPSRPKWFCDGTLNVCYNALDRHVRGDLADSVALVYDSPTSSQVLKFTYAQLLEQTQLVAGVLRDQCGVSKGDFVIIYMPKVVETVLVLLACARIGAVSCTVYGGMIAAELTKRIDHCQAKLVVTVSGGLAGGRVFDYKKETEQALQGCVYKPNRCLVLRRDGLGSQELNPERDLCWSQAISSARPCLDCVPLEANEPSFLYYTSGTTGDPKGVLLPVCNCLSYLYCSSYYVRLPTDGQRHVFFTTSEFGWILSQYYLVTIPLLTGQSAVIFEGDFGPGATSKHFPRLVAQHEITFVISCNAPFREIRQQDPNYSFSAKFDCKSLSLVLLGGECSDCDLLRWISEAFSCIASDCYGQTEAMNISGSIGEVTCPTLRHFTASWLGIGLDVCILKEDGQPADSGEVGRISIRTPLRPGSLLTIYKNDSYFEKEYFQSFPGYYDTKDGGRFLQQGQLSLYGRDDDVIIMDGDRIHGNNLEQELRRMETIRDCAVVPGPSPAHWEEPVAFVVFANGYTLESEEVKLARTRLLECLALKAASVVPVNELPVTRSGKVSRRTLKDLLTQNGPRNFSMSCRNPDSAEQIYLTIGRLRMEQKMPASTR